MHIYKYSKILALCATVVWLLFIFSAFKGFHFWYAGFVFFFWFFLATLNYRHETTLWLVKNRFKKFARFYLILLVVGFVADFVIGQQIAHLWSYPFYDSFDDWLRLYTIIYPFGGLTILELSFLLGNLFHERFIFLPKVHNTVVRSIDSFDHIVDAFLAILLIGGPIMYFSGVHAPLAQVIVYAFLLWAIVTTVEIAYHLRHGSHWVAIFLVALFMSVLLHEVPNTAAFEWKYGYAPILNASIVGIPLWVIVGWYLMTLVMLRLWLRFMLDAKRAK